MCTPTQPTWHSNTTTFLAADRHKKALPFWLEVEGTDRKHSLCDREMDNSCQYCPVCYSELFPHTVQAADLTFIQMKHLKSVTESFNALVQCSLMKSSLNYAFYTSTGKYYSSYLHSNKQYKFTAVGRNFYLFLYLQMIQLFTHWKIRIRFKICSAYS